MLEKTYLAVAVLRIFQFALALTVCGLYGVDLTAARNAGKYQDGKWVYAVVLGAFSAFSALLYMIPFIFRFSIMFVWEAILFFLWIVLFGIFGNMYIKENAEGDSGVQRMKNAVWVDLANALLWLITACVMAGYWWRNRNGKSVFTSRARNHV